LKKETEALDVELVRWKALSQRKFEIDRLLLWPGQYLRVVEDGRTLAGEVE
jgi:hypothetical protein